MTLQHGSVSCTDSNKLHSGCTFRCNDGYRLVGNSITTCGLGADKGGEWDNDAPVCEGKIILIVGVSMGQK